MSGQNSAARPPTQSRRWLLINAALALSLIAVAVGVLVWAARQSTRPVSETARRDADRQGVAAPAFTLPTADGQPVSLADYRGRVILVNFWATWCPPCVAELPTLNAFYQARQAEGFVVIAVNDQETPAAVQAFVSENHLSFPVALDRNETVMAAYDVRALPVSIIIDRAGNIRTIHRGEISAEQLAEKINPLLN